MSDKLKNLVNSASEQSDEATKLAEEVIAQGQLMGRGFNYEVFEKEGAPFGKALAALKGLPAKGLKAAKEIPGKAHKKIKGLGQGILLKSQGYVPGKGGVNRNVAAGYGALTLAGAGVAGTGIGIRKLVKGKEKQAAEEKIAEEKKAAQEKKAAEEKKAGEQSGAFMSDFILRYQQEKN